MTDALAKLLIAKDVISEKEFKAQLSAERANYLAVLQRLRGAREGYRLGSSSHEFSLKILIFSV
jgi:hypothetical protein